MFSKVHSIHRKDLKSFIMDILLNKPDKFIEQYDLGRFDFIIWGVIRNQYYSKTSPFRKKFLTNDGPDIDRLEIIDDEPEDEFIDEEALIVLRIKQLLLRQHWFNVTMFNKYYFDKMTYKEIQKDTGVHHLRVRRVVIETLEHIKKELKDYKLPSRKLSSSDKIEINSFEAAPTQSKKIPKNL